MTLDDADLTYAGMCHEGIILRDSNGNKWVYSPDSNGDVEVQNVSYSRIRPAFDKDIIRILEPDSIAQCAPLWY